MASYGYARYGFATYGIEIDPLDTNIGGLIRFHDNGTTPYLIVTRTPDHIFTVNTSITEEGLKVLRSMPDEFLGVIRVQTHLDLEATKTALPDEVLALQRSVDPMQGVALIRHRGEGVLEIKP